MTGAAGLIASWTMIRLLLSQGYSVRGTARAKNAEKQAWLFDLPEAKERLELDEASLNTAGSYDEAIAGSDFVLGCASPYAFNVDDSKRDLVDPTVNGTRFYLKLA